MIPQTSKAGTSAPNCETSAENPCSRATAGLAQGPLLCCLGYNISIGQVSFLHFPDRCSAKRTPQLPSTGWSSFQHLPPAEQLLSDRLNSTRTALVAQLVKNPPARWKTWAWSLRWEDPLEKGTTTHSSILAWRMSWLHNPWGSKESDVMERLSLSLLSKQSQRGLCVCGKEGEAGEHGGGGAGCVVLQFYYNARKPCLIV